MGCISPWISKTLVSQLDGAVARVENEHHERHKGANFGGKAGGESRNDLFPVLKDEKNVKRAQLINFLTHPKGERPSRYITLQIHDTRHYIRCVLSDACIEDYEKNPKNGALTGLRGAVIKLLEYTVHLHPERNRVSVHLVIEKFDPVGGQGCISNDNTSYAPDLPEVKAKIAQLMETIERSPTQDSDSSWSDVEMLLSELSAKEQDDKPHTMAGPSGHLYTQAGEDQIHSSTPLSQSRNPWGDGEELTDTDCIISASQNEKLENIRPQPLPSVTPPTPLRPTPMSAATSAGGRTPASAKAGTVGLRSPSLGFHSPSLSPQPSEGPSDPGESPLTRRFRKGKMKAIDEGEMAEPAGGGRMEKAGMVGAERPCKPQDKVGPTVSVGGKSLEFDPRVDPMFISQLQFSLDENGEDSEGEMDESDGDDPKPNGETEAETQPRHEGFETQAPAVVDTQLRVVVGPTETTQAEEWSSPTDVRDDYDETLEEFETQAHVGMATQVDGISELSADQPSDSPPDNQQTPSRRLSKSILGSIKSFAANVVAAVGIRSPTPSTRSHAATPGPRTEEVVEEDEPRGEIRPENLLARLQAAAGHKNNVETGNEGDDQAGVAEGEPEQGEKTVEETREEGEEEFEEFLTASVKIEEEEEFDGAEGGDQHHEELNGSVDRFIGFTQPHGYSWQQTHDDAHAADDEPDHEPVQRDEGKDDGLLLETLAEKYDPYQLGSGVGFVREFDEAAQEDAREEPAFPSPFDYDNHSGRASTIGPEDEDEAEEQEGTDEYFEEMSQEGSPNGSADSSHEDHSQASHHDAPHMPAQSQVQILESCQIQIQVTTSVVRALEPEDGIPIESRGPEEEEGEKTEEVVSDEVGGDNVDPMDIESSDVGRREASLHEVAQDEVMLDAELDEDLVQTPIGVPTVANESTGHPDGTGASSTPPVSTPWRDGQVFVSGRTTQSTGTGLGVMSPPIPTQTTFSSSQSSDKGIVLPAPSQKRSDDAESEGRGHVDLDTHPEHTQQEAPNCGMRSGIPQEEARTNVGDYGFWEKGTDVGHMWDPPQSHGPVREPFEGWEQGGGGAELGESSRMQSIDSSQGDKNEFLEVSTLGQHPEIDHTHTSAASIETPEHEMEDAWLNDEADKDTPGLSQASVFARSSLEFASQTTEWGQDSSPLLVETDDERSGFASQENPNPAFTQGRERETAGSSVAQEILSQHVQSRASSPSFTPPSPTSLRNEPTTSAVLNMRSPRPNTTILSVVESSLSLEREISLSGEEDEGSGALGKKPGESDTNETVPDSEEQDAALQPSADQVVEQEEEDHGSASAPASSMLPETVPCPPDQKESTDPHLKGLRKGTVAVVTLYSSDEESSDEEDTPLLRSRKRTLKADGWAEEKVVKRPRGRQRSLIPARVGKQKVSAPNPETAATVPSRREGSGEGDMLDGRQSAKPVGAAAQTRREETLDDSESIIVSEESRDRASEKTAVDLASSPPTALGVRPSAAIRKKKNIFGFNTLLERARQPLSGRSNSQNPISVNAEHVQPIKSSSTNPPSTSSSSRKRKLPWNGDGSETDNPKAGTGKRKKPDSLKASAVGTAERRAMRIPPRPTLDVAVTKIWGLEDRGGLDISRWP